jgi:membrane protease YdiL (CAAX protease family)
VNIITILIVVLAAKRSGKGFKQFMGLTKGKNTPKKLILLVLVLTAVGYGGLNLAGLVCYGSIMPKVSVEHVVAPIPFVLALVNLVLLPATISFAEDGLYLGCGVNSFKNKYAAIIIPALFYTLQHCFIPTIFDVKYMLYRFLMFLPLTVIFCVYYRRKKNPVPLMIAHAVLDFATGMLILITSSSAQLYEKMESML